MKSEFGAYDLRKQIGKGGMAWVYLAMQRALDRQVAIKILFPHLAEDEKFVARFELEARAAAKMRHENIVQVYDYGKFEDQPYIAMEYVDGLNLREWLDTHGPPPLEVALVMLRDLCRGLEHAHSRDIIHRDIKPSNVMLTLEGSVKLMDFGLARRAEDHTVLTEHGAMLGTVPYMSTEQSLGQRVGKPSDIFSLGVVCYEILGGQRPFVGDTQSAITDAILHEEPRSLAGLNPVVPDRLAVAILHMLEKDASKRCQDIAEVRQVLDDLMVDYGIFQDRALLAEYARDPRLTGQKFARAGVARHLQRAAALEKEGPEAFDRALREYRCVIHLEARHPEAKAALERLAGKRQKRAEVQSNPAAGAQPEPGPAPAVGPPKPPPSITRSDAETRPSAAAPQRPAPAPAVPPAERSTAARPSGPSAKDGAATRSAAPTTGQSDKKPTLPRPPMTQMQHIRVMLIAASALLLTMVVVWIAYLVLRPRPEPTQPVVHEPAPTATTMPSVDSSVVSNPPVPKDSTPVLPGYATLTVTTVPSAAFVSVDDTLKRDSTQMAVFGDLLEGRHTVRARKPGYQSKRRSVQIYGGRDTAITLLLSPDSTPPTQPANQTAASVPRNLTVRSFPLNARVRIGEGAEEPSPALFRALPTGHHTVRVTLDAYKTFEKQIAFSATRDSTMDVRLEPVAGAGRVSLRATPLGDYFVDGVLRAERQESAEIALLPGRHVIEMRNPLLYGDPTRNKISFKAGEVKFYATDFGEDIGFLKITTSDGGQARLLLGGKRQPNPAPGVFPVKKGTYNVWLERDGEATVEGLQSKKVVARETVAVHFTWKR